MGDAVKQNETSNDTDRQSDMADELGPHDHAREARGRAEEAAFLAEHIKEHDPRWTRDQQMQLLTDLIDQSAEHALSCELQLERSQNTETESE